MIRARVSAKGAAAHAVYLFALALAATLIENIATRIVIVQLLAAGYAVFNYHRGLAAALRIIQNPRK